MADYDVVLLIEKALSTADATQVRSLHTELTAEGERVRYHVLLPLEDAAAAIASLEDRTARGKVVVSLR